MDNFVQRVQNQVLLGVEDVAVAGAGPVADDGFFLGRTVTFSSILRIITSVVIADHFGDSQQFVDGYGLTRIQLADRILRSQVVLGRRPDMKLILVIVAGGNLRLIGRCCGEAGIDSSRAGLGQSFKILHAGAIAAVGSSRGSGGGQQGDEVHANPALVDAAPVSGAGLHNLINVHGGTGDQLANLAIASAGALTDVQAAVGVGNNTLSHGGNGGAGTIGVGGGHASGSAVGLANGAFPHIHILLKDPAAGLGIVVHIHIQIVPAILLVILQDVGLGAGGQGADLLIVQAGANTNLGCGAVDDDSVLIGGGLRHNTGQSGPADILGGQVRPATLVSTGCGCCLGIILIIDIRNLTAEAPDILANQSNFPGIKLHALVHLEYDVSVTSGLISDRELAGGNGVAHRPQLDGGAGSSQSYSGGTCQRSRCITLISCIACNLHPALCRDRLFPIQSILVLGRPQDLDPQLRTVQSHVGNGNICSALQIIVLQADSLIDGIGICVGGNMNSAHRNVLNGLAGEGIGQSALTGDIHIGIAVKHDHVGIGQADPAAVDAAPLMAVAGDDLEDIHSFVIPNGSDDIIVGACGIADIHVAIIGNGGLGDSAGGSTDGDTAVGTGVQNNPLTFRGGLCLSILFKGSCTGDVSASFKGCANAYPSCALQVNVFFAGLNACNRTRQRLFMIRIRIGINIKCLGLQLRNAPLRIQNRYQGIRISYLQLDPLLCIASGIHPLIGTTVIHSLAFSNLCPLDALCINIGRGNLNLGIFCRIEVPSTSRRLRFSIQVGQIGQLIFCKHGSPRGAVIIALPLGNQGLSGAFAIQLWHKLVCAIGALQIPASKGISLLGGNHRMADLLVRIKIVLVLASSTCNRCTSLSTVVGLVGNSCIVRRSNVGIDTVHVHIGQNLGAGFGVGIRGAIVLCHGADHLGCAGIVDDGGLGGVGAAHPGRTGQIGQNGQSVMLTLVQGHTVGGGEGIHLLVDLGQTLAQSSIRRRLAHVVTVRAIIYCVSLFFIGTLYRPILERKRLTIRCSDKLGGSSVLI